MKKKVYKYLLSKLAYTWINDIFYAFKIIIFLCCNYLPPFNSIKTVLSSWKIFSLEFSGEHHCVEKSTKIPLISSCEIKNKKHEFLFKKMLFINLIFFLNTTKGNYKVLNTKSGKSMIYIFHTQLWHTVRQIPVQNLMTGPFIYPNLVSNITSLCNY